MTTLMLEELNQEQRGALDEQPSDQKTPNESLNKSPNNPPNPWEPQRKPSQPAIRPWWQKHDRRDQASGSQPDPLWGRGIARPRSG
jgi:hypothetical protein